MITYNHLWEKLTSFGNLRIAYEKAKRGKTGSPSVREFSEHWMHNLAVLRLELITKQYRPLPLTRFVLRDPKTRVIYKSGFRDRIVHHALVNILEQIYEPRFIHDSYASRKGKGTSKALERFKRFIRTASRNGKLKKDAWTGNDIVGYALKCDIKHYFETVDHSVLLGILCKRIKDKDVLWLVETILNHYPTRHSGKGMPLGNWTSQFFANVYLDELDQYVKHELKAEYYMRYVDDFVILDQNVCSLEECLAKIRVFLAGLELELHPAKCRIIPLSSGVDFLGFKIFYHHLSTRKKNRRKLLRKLCFLLDSHQKQEIDYASILNTLSGWNGYALQGNTYRLRTQIRAWVLRELSTIAKNSCQPV